MEVRCLVALMLLAGCVGGAADSAPGAATGQPGLSTPANTTIALDPAKPTPPPARPACPEQAVACPAADPSVILDATRRVTHFLKVPASESEAFLPPGWPATCHTHIRSECVTDAAGLADLWWLVLDFTGGRTGQQSIGAGQLGFVLVETRAQGALERPTDVDNHEFVPIDLFTQEPVLHEWLRHWRLTSAAAPDAEISIAVAGSEPDVWSGGAAGTSGAIGIDGAGVFHTVAPLVIERDDDYRIFPFDASAGDGPESFVSLRTSYGSAEAGISWGGSAQGHVPGFSADTWAADATWIAMDHEVELLHETIAG